MNPYKNRGVDNYVEIIDKYPLFFYTCMEKKLFLGVEKINKERL
jgi:hypothetical protein